VCGVFGFIGRLDRHEWAEAHGLLHALALASERRGVDASGYAALTTRGVLLWGRQPGPARGLFAGREFQALRGRRVLVAIGHTRQATTGDPACNDNNHPHLAGGWALVHNGYLPGHREKARRLRLPLETDCDSELLVEALHRYGEAAGPDVCLSLAGKQSVLAIDARTRRLVAWTNGEMPLVAFRVKGWRALWWASTEQIAREALGIVGLQAKFASAQSRTVYRIEWRDEHVALESTPAQSQA
jgi:glucosamine 6-phosphate synthetase-like amidotransferase/phosphosugar isomerase protein